VIEMVENHRDLPNAIALNSAMVNGSRIGDPSIGGVLIAAVGEGWSVLSMRVIRPVYREPHFASVNADSKTL
jgi:Transmembrane secretion effector